MWSELLTNPNKKFHLHIELTTKCNSACPLCPRFVFGTTELNPAISLKELHLEEMKSWFPPELCNKVGSINFCGNFGDPASCKDMYPIVEYFHKSNPNTNIEIRTNGGMQSVDVWKKLGKLSKNSDKKIKVIFSVDGTEETNDLYRRNVSWDILIRNIEAYTHSGGHAWQEFLVFNHNEHEMKDAQDLAASLGIEYVNFKQAFGFEDYGLRKTRAVAIYDKNGHFEYYLRPSKTFNSSDLEYDNNLAGIISGNQVATINKKDVPFYLNYDWMNGDCDVFFEEYKNRGGEFNELENKPIRCMAHSSHGEYIEIYLNSNGDVRPCCHIGVESDRHSADVVGYQLNNKILSPPQDFNIRTNSLKNILELFDERIYNTWDKKHEEGRCYKCSLQCGRRDVMEELYLEDVSRKLNAELIKKEKIHKK